MMIMDNDVLLRACLIIHELADSINQNQKLTSAINARAAALKDQAAQSISGFALRRVNTDISKEFFESELERTNAQLVVENQTLLHENKQLSMLLKEHENTLETVMSKFRHHALAAQHHEQTLTRHYETLLLACDSQNLYTSLANETQTAHGLQRLAVALRSLYRTLIGEDPESSDSEPLDLHALIESLSDESATPIIQDDWALERETEISRLRQENEELRKMLGIDPNSLQEKGIMLDMEREGGEIGRLYAALRSDAPRRRSESMSPRGSRFSAWASEESSRETAPWQGWDTNTGPQHQQQLSHPQPPQQHQAGNAPPHQRAMDLQPGIRMQQPRRPPMFARAAAPAPPVSVGPNRNIPPSQWSQQAWSPAGSALDLSR
ncbi:hypothetical protein M404DRAFT_24036 [Pisolithus tinctorius Marx 270]|uniref:Uncharacterized protein n=1 Tax=Pisolithus tinctorius Marx 270 TaxID=870435 RepID=A0A0C3JCU1_PISTI|nr:hypothetical protein M404DRAFT_24036 [Pisolithus tinctorius Marx 270]